jgi:DNA repair photolyase
LRISVTKIVMAIGIATAIMFTPIPLHGTREANTDQEVREKRETVPRKEFPSSFTSELLKGISD